MQKHIIFIVFTLLFSFSASAQLEVTFSTNSTPTPGGTVDVDVSVSNFDDIVTLQYFILWDSLVLSYDSIFNVTDQLEQFSIGSVGTPETAVILDDGEMSVSWSHSSTNPFSIPDNTTLFTVRMNVVGTDCDSTAITIGNIPPFQNIEVINGDFDDIGAVSNMLPFAIPGTDCESGGGGGGGGGGQDGIVLSSTSVSGDSGDNVCVSVTVDNFLDVQTAQASMMWDPAVLSFTGTQNPVLPGTVFGENSTDQGMLAFNWFDNSGVTPQNLPNGSVLFDVCFDIVGAPGTSSTFKFTDDPSIIVFSDSNDEELDFTTGSSTVSVNDDGGGGGGGGGGDGDLTITMEDMFGNPGSNVCIPMTADGFTNIQTFQGGLMWDPDVLTYTGINNSSLPGLALGDNQAPQGMLGFNWFDDSGVTPVTLPDGGTVFEICFDVTGGAGSTSTLKIIDLTNVFVEASDADGNTLDVTTVDGTFTASGDVPFVLSCSGTTFQNGDNGCINVRSTGFSNIASIQFQMTWDDSQLSYTGVENLNTLQAGDFNQTQNNVIRVSWNSTNGQGQNVPNGSLLFSVCFDAIECSSDTDLTGQLQFVGDAQVPIEIGNGDGDQVAIVDLMPCSYTINCDSPPPPPDCTINFGTANISPPACFGEATGSITINPTATPADCEIVCTWFDATPGGGVIPTTGCSLSGVRAGSYVLRVEVPGVTVSEMTYIIPEADALNISGNIFPETCNALGGVNTTISGGSGTYNCVWDTGAIGCNIGGLASGTYRITVTDAIEGCDQVAEFVVGIDQNLNGTATTINAGCDGGSITINLNQAGPFNYEWSHPEGTNAAQQNNLDPGTYTCTITSANGNCSTVVSATVGNSVQGPFVEQLTTTDTSCNGDDGTASFIITEGCLPYTCEVTAPDGTILSCDNLDNLIPGVYGIMISDASTNPAFVEGFTIGVLDPVDVVITTTPESLISPGTILTTTTGGTPGYSYNWAPEDAPGLVQGAPNQVDLEDGEYGLTVTDMAGCTWAISEAIIVGTTVPDGPPVVSNEFIEETSCGNECDGIYNADVNGQSPFNFAFTNDEGNVFEFSSLPATGLCQGDYELVVTDIDGLSTTLNVNVGGAAPIVVTEEEILCDDGTNSGSILISAVGGAGGLMPAWSQIDDTTFNPENLQEGTYEVEVLDILGCSSGAIIFTVMDCDSMTVDGACGDGSTVLTPNGDGVNDDLFVMCAGDFPNTFAIYDRFGRLVHEAVNYDGTWDGTDLNGEIVTEGVYYWVMDSTFDNGDHRIFKGFVNVIRETR